MATISKSRISALWISFEDDVIKSNNLEITQSFYRGYAYCLLREGKISQKQFNKIVQKLNEVSKIIERNRNLRINVGRSI